MKTKILLIWQYARKDWVEVFENLSEDFEFVFCAEVFPGNSIKNVSHFAKVTYWSNYSSAQKMLAHIKPHKIVFMGTEGLHTSALNYASKKKGIETLYLQHGLYAPLKFYLKSQEATNKLNPNNSLTKNKNHGIFMLKFYLATFRLNLKALIYLKNYVYFKNKLSQTQFLVNHQFKYRVVDKYIVFTKENAKFLSQRDGFNESKYMEIGNPSYDKYLTAPSGTKNYILLIDTPLVETIAEGKKIKKKYSKEFVNTFYSLINDYAKKNDLKLYIKLHPFNYKSKFYLTNDNITYFRQTDVVRLINNSAKIISFSSSLTLAGILNKDFMLIRTDKEQPLLNDLENFGMKRFPLLKDLSFENIQFQNLNHSPIVKEHILDKYLYKLDGKATKRLQNILDN